MAWIGAIVANRKRKLIEEERRKISYPFFYIICKHNKQRIRCKICNQS